MAYKFEMIPFDDRQIMTVQRDGGIYVVMKPIVEALGLTWQGQLERIKRNPLLSEGVSVTLIPSGGGTQDAVTLELEQFHGWLMTLSTERIADESKRDAIIAYQRRAFRVVFEHFHGKIGRPQKALSVSGQVALQNQLLRLSGQLQAAGNVAERQMIHAMMDQMCQQLGIATPELDAIGREAIAASVLAQPFWDGLAVLRAKGVAFDHSRSANVLAISLKELVPHFAKAGVRVEIDAAMREALRQSVAPRFISGKIVNSRISGHGQHCWVFEAPGNLLT